MPVLRRWKLAVPCVLGLGAVLLIRWTLTVQPAHPTCPPGSIAALMTSCATPPSSSSPDAVMVFPKARPAAPLAAAASVASSAAE